jgi:hypothetical protein
MLCLYLFLKYILVFFPKNDLFFDLLIEQYQSSWSLHENKIIGVD